MLLLLRKVLAEFGFQQQLDWIMTELRFYLLNM